MDEKIRGYVTSCRYSRRLEATIGLALVEAELSAAGTTIRIFQEGLGDLRLEAVVVPTPFLDPEGTRMRM